MTDTEIQRDQDLFMAFAAIGRSKICSADLLYLLRSELEAVLRLSKSNIDGLNIVWEKVFPRLRIASNETDANKQWWKEYDPTI